MNSNLQYIDQEIIRLYHDGDKEKALKLFVNEYIFA